MSQTTMVWQNVLCMRCLTILTVAGCPLMHGHAHGMASTPSCKTGYIVCVPQAPLAPLYSRHFTGYFSWYGSCMHFSLKTTHDKIESIKLSTPKNTKTRFCEITQKKFNQNNSEGSIETRLSERSKKAVFQNYPNLPWTKSVNWSKSRLSKY